MHKSVTEHILKVSKLVEEGKLPETAFPRLFWMGHELLYIYGQPSDKKEVKCVDCDKIWVGVYAACPDCNGKNIFYIENDRIGQWRCFKCKHEWKSENGEICPSCGSESKLGI